MDAGTFKLVVAAILFFGAAALSIISLGKHGKFLVRLGKSNPSLASSLDWNYFGDGASRRGYQIMVFFYRRKYEDLDDNELTHLGAEIRRLSWYSILLTVASMITLSL